MLGSNKQASNQVYTHVFNAVWGPLRPTKISFKNWYQKAERNPATEIICSTTTSFAGLTRQTSMEPCHCYYNSRGREGPVTLSGFPWPDCYHTTNKVSTISHMRYVWIRHELKRSYDTWWMRPGLPVSSASVLYWTQQGRLRLRNEVKSHYSPIVKAGDDKLGLECRSASVMWPPNNQIFKATTGKSGHGSQWERTVLHSMEVVVCCWSSSLKKYICPRLTITA